MERSRLGKSIDNLTLALAIFVLAFMFFKQFIAKSHACLVLAIFLDFVIMFAIITFQNKRYEKLSIKKSELKLIEKYNFELRKLGHDGQRQFFENMLCPIGFKPLFDGLANQNTYICFCLAEDELTTGDVFKTYSLISDCNIQEIVFVCNGVSTKAQETKDKLQKKIYFFSPVETFALMKKFNCFPNSQNDGLEPVKTHHFSPILQSFAKKRARVLIRIGILLDVLAMFVPFSKYYLIVGSLSLLLGVICLLFGQKEKSADEPPSLLK